MDCDLKKVSGEKLGGEIEQFFYVLSIIKTDIQKYVTFANLNWSQLGPCSDSCNPLIAGYPFKKPGKPDHTEEGHLGALG